MAPRGPEGWPPGFAIMAGWLPAARVLLRLDIAERIAGELGYQTRRAPAPVPDGLASRLGVKADTLPMALEAMGFRLMPGSTLAENEFGPPLPARIGVLRPERQAPQNRGPRRGAVIAIPPMAVPVARVPAPRESAAGERVERPPFFGPPVPPELRQQRFGRGRGREGTATIPPVEARRAEQIPRPARTPRIEFIPPAAPRVERIPPASARPDGARPDNSRPDGPRQDRRPERGGDRGADRGRRGPSEPVELIAGQKADSPFAVLAKLKLRKD